MKKSVFKVLVVSLLFIVLTVSFIGCQNTEQEISDDSQTQSETPDQENTEEAPIMPENEQESQQNTAGDVRLPAYRAARVNYAGDSVINESSLNSSVIAETAILSSELHLPLFRFDSLSDLEKFKSDFGEILNLNEQYGDVYSFSQVVWDYDEKFFEENCLICVYKVSGSGSFTYGITEIRNSGSSLCVYVAQTNNPEVYTTDMAGWLLILEQNKSDLENCAEYDALYIGLADTENPVEPYTSGNGNTVYADVQYMDFSSVQTGNIVKFGHYEQDNDANTGSEEIEWIVLEVSDKTALLISRYALDCQPYNALNENTTWETCSLRKWLNETFIAEAFSDDELEMIKTVTVTAEKNPDSDTPAGNDTGDRVFLLSVSEAEKYFGSKELRACSATEYAKARCSYPDDELWFWWLRTPGYEATDAAVIYNDGHIETYGRRADWVKNDNYSVRPALYIEFK